MHAKASTESRTDFMKTIFAGRLSEDPLREPHEKEWAIYAEGDSPMAELHSFKRVVYEKLLYHPRFELKWLNVRDFNGEERTVSLGEFVENPALTVIGVAGRIPVGCISIGVGRQSDSHSEVVK